jgi:hypothetical protein
MNGEMSIFDEAILASSILGHPQLNEEFPLLFGGEPYHFPYTTTNQTEPVNYVQEPKETQELGDTFIDKVTETSGTIEQPHPVQARGKRVKNRSAGLPSEQWQKVGIQYRSDIVRNKCLHVSRCERPGSHRQSCQSGPEYCII